MGAQNSAAPANIQGQTDELRLGPALAAAGTAAVAFATSPPSPLSLQVDAIPPARKIANCVPLLLNIMFRDLFIMETLGSESRLTRDQLDTGSVGSERLYWNRIHSRFVDPTFNSGGNVLETDADLECPRIVAVTNLDPEYLPRMAHSQKKLFEMYDVVRRAYNKARANFTVSGTHQPDFFMYCDPSNLKLDNIVGVRASDIFYFRGWILRRG